MPRKNDIRDSAGLKNIFNIIKYYILPYSIFLVIIFLLFKDSTHLGMQFDEVIRINNLLPFFYPDTQVYDQNIFSIHLFGYHIPLIYKFYLSSAMLIPYIPLALFKNDLLFGLRFLYGFYFFLSISVFFLIMSRKIDYTISLLTSILIITSPLFYPDALLGFAHSIHLIFISCAIYSFYLFFEEHRSQFFLFLGTFLLFFEANIEAYFLWVIAGLTIASIVIFSQYWKKVLGSIQYCLVILAAIILGWINFLIYNIFVPFATIKPIYFRIFDPLTYAESPVDYKQTSPLFADVWSKLTTTFPSFYSDYGIFYIILIIAMTILYIFLASKIIKMHRISQYKQYFFPFLCFSLIFILILLSPNTTRAGHYVYLIPFFELSIVFLFLLGEKIFNRKYLSKVLIITLIGLIVLNSVIIGMEVSSYRHTRGQGIYSPAIFDLNDYIHDESIRPDDIIFLEWGMYSQLYFLNKGDFKIHSIVFQLYDTKDSEERKSVFTKFFLKQKNPGQSDRLYFPLYRDGFNSRNDAILADFIEFITENNGTVKKIATFYETNGDEVMDMYALENSERFLQTIQSGNKK